MARRIAQFYKVSYGQFKEGYEDAFGGGEEEEIRKAYLIRLPQFHPEENPEGFRALRQALEDAMEYGAQQRKAREGAEEGLKKTGIMDSREIQAFNICFTAKPGRLISVHIKPELNCVIHNIGSRNFYVQLFLKICFR